jgi:hypothetical protein
LEVIAGPSHGINRYLQSDNTSMLPMTLGRVPQSGLVLKDSEVSGKHAQINWNANVSCSLHFLFFSPSACYCIQTIDHFEN